MNYDGPVPRYVHDNHLIEVNENDKKVGYVWFKGRKIPVSGSVNVISIPYISRLYEDEEGT